jgi:Mrp family chromosome partitioning ATPase
MADTHAQVVAFHSDAPEDGVFPLPLLHAPDSKLAASYRVLCHRIVEENDPAVIAITSPGRSEGKTTCAVNLAMAFAEYRKSPVLLLDANFRAPALGVALGFAPPACFGEQLEQRRSNGGRAAPWQLCAAFHDNLHVLAVDPAKAAQWRLDAPTFRTAIEELRASRYERIVIDCPHVLESADVHIVQDAADAILLTAWAGKTTARHLNLAAERLAPANVIGVSLVR